MQKNCKTRAQKRVRARAFVSFCSTNIEHLPKISRLENFDRTIFFPATTVKLVFTQLHQRQVFEYSKKETNFRIGNLFSFMRLQISIIYNLPREGKWKRQYFRKLEINSDIDNM